MTEIDIHTFGRHANAGHASSFGAHVLDWQPNSDHPLLWLSPRAVTDGTAPIRGGIPVCAPWFAAPDQSPALPRSAPPSPSPTPSPTGARTQEASSPTISPPAW